MQKERSQNDQVPSVIQSLFLHMLENKRRAEEKQAFHEEQEKRQREQREQQQKDAENQQSGADGFGILSRLLAHLLHFVLRTVIACYAKIAGIEMTDIERSINPRGETQAEAAAREQLRDDFSRIPHAPAHSLESEKALFNAYENPLQSREAEKSKQTRTKTVVQQKEAEAEHER